MNDTTPHQLHKLNQDKHLQDGTHITHDKGAHYQCIQAIIKETTNQDTTSFQHNQSLPQFIDAVAEGLGQG
jgi:hypothetical protein